MKQLTDAVDQATDQAVAVLEQVQDAAIGAVASVSDAVATYVPELGLGETLRPEELVASSFKISDKFIEAGRKAALGFVGAVAPLTDKVLGSKKPAKPAAKTSV